MSHATQPLPSPTVRNLAPPNTDYPYFANVTVHPFESAAQEFSLANAGLLIDASLLAYFQDDQDDRDDDLLPGVLQGRRYSVVTKEKSQAILLREGPALVVAFRGTRIDKFPDPITTLQEAVPLNPDTVPEGQTAWVNWRDTVTDADFGMDHDGVHGGFHAALDEAWSDLGDAVTALTQGEEGVRLWFTGHSLGGALATLAADRFQREVGQVQGLYTFGSPRVGDAAFRDNFPVRCFRVVNGSDVIARLPPSTWLAPYTHVGTPKFIRGEDGAIVDDTEAEDDIAANVTRTIESLRSALELLNPLESIRDFPQLFEGSPLDLLQPSVIVDRVLHFKLVEDVRSLNVPVPVARLVDHAPINYAIRIWNQVR